MLLSPPLNQVRRTDLSLYSANIFTIEIRFPIYKAYGQQSGWNLYNEVPSTLFSTINTTLINISVNQNGSEQQASRANMRTCGLKCPHVTLGSELISAPQTKCYRVIFLAVMNGQTKKLGWPLSVEAFRGSSFCPAPWPGLNQASWSSDMAGFALFWQEWTSGWQDRAHAGLQSGDWLQATVKLLDGE